MKKSGSKIVITSICLIIVCVWAWMSSGNSPIGFSAAPIAPGTPKSSFVADAGSPAVATVADIESPEALVAEMVPDPVTERVTAPAAEAVTDPVAEMVPDPATESETTPAAESETVPVIESPTQSPAEHTTQTSSPLPSSSPSSSPDESSLPAASLLAPLPEPAAEPAAVAQEATTAAQEPTAATQGLDPETGKDKYLTDAVPAGKPLPVEPENAAITDAAFTITLSVRCDTLLENMALLDKEKHELVPADGFIFPAASVLVYEGESVFNVLQREMKKARVHMEFVNTPVYNSAYIEGIHNLYEFDAGELSGWMYKVNDWFPNYGCSRYQLKSGDIVEWVYTCDLGRDVGEYWLGGGQNDGQRGGRSGQRDD